MQRPARAVPEKQLESRAWRGFGWPGVVLIVAVVAAVYAPQLNHPFQFDDIPKIVDNPRIANPALLEEDFQLGRYSEAVTRLLPNLSLSFDFARAGLSPYAFHLTNLLLHLVNIALVFALVQALTARMANASAHVAWLSAALFGAHPLNSEAVYYCNARPNLMLTTFYLAALVFLIEAIDSPSASRVKRGAAWLLCVVCAVAALSSKELAITLLLTAPLLVYWLSLGEQAAYTQVVRRGAPIAIGVAVVGVAMFFVTGASVAVTRFWSQRSLGELALIFADQSTIVFRYLALWLCPWPGFLLVDHSALGHLHLRMRDGADGSQLVWPVLASVILLGVLVAAWRMRKRAALPTFAIFFAAVTHAPLWLMPRGEAMVEYRTYLPMVGLCVLLACMLVRLGEWLSERFDDPSRSLQLASYGIVLTTLCVLTAMRGQAWASQEGLWRDVLAKAPNTARAYLALGELARERRDLDTAITLVRKSVALDPRFSRGHSSLGGLLAARGDLEGGRESLLRAFALDPNDYQAANNLGNVMLGLNDPALAKRYYREALLIQPVFAEAELNLAQLERKQGQLETALPHYRRALQLAPRLPVVYLMYGRALFEQGRTSSAIEMWRRGLALDARQPAVHAQLAQALIIKGDRQAGLRHMQIAIELAPDNPDVINAAHFVHESSAR